jgi:antitoxin (DNA-binding transcriptional repressor) of toxin-antitoxin stability system
VAQPSACSVGFSRRFLVIRRATGPKPSPQRDVLSNDMAVLYISEADLALDVHGVLDRVQSGAEIIIERNDQPVAVLRAANPRRRKLSEIVAALAPDSTATVDPDFARDVLGVIDSHREPSRNGERVVRR